MIICALHPTPGGSIGPYRVVRKLGAGGMGEVYLAEDPRLRRNVALKLIAADSRVDETARARFVKEARAASALNHPNIVTVYDIGQAGTAHYMAIEYIEGETLRDHIRRGPLPASQVAKAGAQIAAALARAHVEGIVHRDLKPENVMIRRDGLLKVLDFGVAKLLDRATGGGDAEHSTEAESTRSGMLIGTLSYMSPEQARGQGIDGRTDIFSLGLVLYEALAGANPVRRATHVETLHAITAEPIPPVARTAPVPSELARIVDKCLERDRADRYQHADDLEVDLRRAAEGGRSVAGASIPAPAVAATGSSRGRAWKVATAISVLVAAAASAVALLPRQAPRHPVMKVTRVTGYPGEERDPRISADGKYMAFVRDLADGRSQVFVRLLAGGTPVQVTDDDMVKREVSYSPDGQTILYSAAPAPRGTTNDLSIYVVPALGGRPRRVTAGRMGDWSPDGKEIVYLLPSSGSAENLWFESIAVVDAAGSRTRVILPSDLTTSRYSPRFSPDGRRIAFSENALGVPPRLCLMARDGSGRRCIEKAGVSPQFGDPFTWAPDSRSIYLSSAGNLWRVNVDDDSPVEQVSFMMNGIGLSHPSLSTDGGRILAASSITTRHLWVAPATGDARSNTAAARQLTFGSATSARPGWSPDGGRVIYDSDDSGASRLWSADVAWTPVPELRNFAQISMVHDSYSRAQFSPEGTRIVFDAVHEGVRQVWVADADGSNARMVTRTAEPNTQVSFGPAGQVVYRSARGGRYRLWILDTNTGAERQLSDDTCSRPDWSPRTNLITCILMDQRKILTLTPRGERVAAFDTARYGMGIRYPTWTPDGRWIAIVNHAQGSNIWLVSPDGRQERPLTAFPSGIDIGWLFSFSPDGKWVMFDRREPEGDIVLLEPAG